MSTSHFPEKGEPVERLSSSLYQRRMLKRPLKNTMSIWDPDTLKVPVYVCILGLLKMLPLFVRVCSIPPLVSFCQECAAWGFSLFSPVDGEFQDVLGCQYLGVLWGFGIILL